MKNTTMNFLKKRGGGGVKGEKEGGGEKEKKVYNERLINIQIY